jgi:sn-glycerol 3-phosphate transport system permease protein
MLVRNKAASLPVAAGGGSLHLRSPLRRLLVKGAGDGQTESGLKRAHFREWRLPFWLLAPQLFILLLFFFIPSIRALIQAFQLTDPFGATTQWVGFDLPPIKWTG